MGSDILVCSKCGDRVIAVAAKEAGLEKCPLPGCGGKYAEEAEEKPKSKK